MESPIDVFVLPTRIAPEKCLLSMRTNPRRPSDWFCPLDAPSPDHPPVWKRGGEGRGRGGRKPLPSHAEVAAGCPVRWVCRLRDELGNPVGVGEEREVSVYLLREIDGSEHQGEAAPLKGGEPSDIELSFQLMQAFALHSSPYPAQSSLYPPFAILTLPSLRNPHQTLPLDRSTYSLHRSPHPPSALVHPTLPSQIFPPSHPQTRILLSRYAHPLAWQSGWYDVIVRASPQIDPVLTPRGFTREEPKQASRCPEMLACWSPPLLHAPQTSKAPPDILTHTHLRRNLQT